MKMPGPPAYYAGLYSRLVDLNREIAQTHAEGYATDVLLDERVEAQQEWDEVQPA